MMRTNTINLLVVTILGAVCCGCGVSNAGGTSLPRVQSLPNPAPPSQPPSAQTDATKASTGQETWSASEALARFDEDGRLVTEEELMQQCTGEDVPFLITALGSQNHAYAYYEVITEVLRKLKDERAAFALSDAFIRADTLNYSAGFALMDLGRDDLLIERLNSKEWGILEVSLNALGKGKSKPAVLPVSQLLFHDDRRIRGKAVEVLGEIGDPAAIDYIMKALRDKDFHFVRKPAIWSLSLFTEKEAVQSLTELLVYKSKNWNADQLNYADAIEAAEALHHRVGRDAIPYLKEYNLRHQGQDWLANWLIDDLQGSFSPFKDIGLTALIGCRISYSKYIADGDQSRISLLVLTLRLFDDKKMATVFLNSGCPELITAANYWAYTHRYQVQVFVGSGGKGPKWGRR